MKNSILLLGIGALSLIGGIIALLNPLAATLTAELLTGYLFIAIGALMLVSIFADDSWGSSPGTEFALIDVRQIRG